ncbi:MAG TPA: hypothetical protein VGH56_05770 [Solirubrobacteraceae bacterium]
MYELEDQPNISAEDEIRAARDAAGGNEVRSECVQATSAYT